MRTKSLIAALAIAALVVPAAATAKPGHGHGAHAVSYVFKGTYGGDGSVDVNHGNAHARHAGLVGVSVQFDLSAAKLTVADTNADGAVDATDIVSGDVVVVHARLTKGDPGTAPYAAKHLIDQTHPAGD